MAHPINIEIGRRIRQRRAYLRVTQKQLADALEITAQQVQKYESGKNSIPVFRLAALLKILDVTPDYFL